MKTLSVLFLLGCLILAFTFLIRFEANYNLGRDVTVDEAMIPFKVWYVVVYIVKGLLSSCL